MNYCKDKCAKHYSRANDLAQNGFGFKKALDVCNSTRLSVALHYGNFLFEQMNKPEDAANLGQGAVDACMEKIDDIADELF